MRRRILRNDMANFVRQSIVMVSLSFVVIKLILTVVRRKELRAIFDGIDEDYEKFNSLPEELHPIIMETINKTKTLEKIWIIVVTVTASSYPVLAGAWTIYSQFFSDNPRRFMIHETAAAEVANIAYSCSWESVQDMDIRKSICMIITKAQIPIHLRALDMLTFNMEMFVSILQTAYSMYTLLRS
ncbi:unnamed protein product, partial [Brenthis ino]